MPMLARSTRAREPFDAIVSVDAYRYFHTAPAP
jgi:cyclopropane fatty-acyl-phospholipid synthase-like methyltransferase